MCVLSIKVPIRKKVWKLIVCTLYDDRNETVSHISECSKWKKKYKNKHDRVRKGIHRKLCKRLKFDHADKWYMHKPESNWENKMHKRTCHFEDFAISANRKVKMKESKKIDKYLDLAWELKKLWNVKITKIPTGVAVLGIVPKSLEKGLEELEIRRRT